MSIKSVADIDMAVDQLENKIMTLLQKEWDWNCIAEKEIQILNIEEIFN